MTIEVAYSKHRREDVLPLRPATAARLRSLLALKAPAAPAFTMPPRRGDTALMLKADLDTARQAWLKETRLAPERARRQQTDFLAYRDAYRLWAPASLTS